MPEPKHQTLGTNVTPSHYTLKFTPNLKTFKFHCEESIEAHVKKKTTKIKLNASNLKVRSAFLNSKGARLKAKSIKLDQKNEELALSFQKAFAGKVTIEITFDGENKDSLSGFYRSTYKKNGKEQVMLTSQFEAADARAAFPCFDEPEFKAIFDVSFVIPKELSAISNTEIKSEKSVSKTHKEVRFKTTPRMSTYLLYLSVGRFTSAQSKLGRIEVRVVSVTAKKEELYLALDYAKKFTDFYQKYFKIKYPLNKLDLIAVQDFAAGAMENWGAMTFREAALLGTEKQTPIATKQRIAEIIAHEIAHQWFGDLVTMKWWNDLWLNESFATFMSYKAMDSVFPEWEMMKQYFDETIATAFAADQYKSTHPISVPVKNPAEINEIFDEISYEKGGSVLYMIEDYVGKEVFREGLTRYLKKHAYSNATKYDLWGAINAAAKKSRRKTNVVSFATSWINKPGYPVVSAQKIGDKVVINQKRFFVLDDEDKNVWPIFVHYLLSDNSEQKFMLLNKRESAIDIGNAQWIKINSSQPGLYRVVYNGNLMSGLGNAIKNKRLSGVDSWGIENDLFAYARSGRITVDKYLDFIEEYCSDADYPLNFSISGHLGWLSAMSYAEKWSGDIDKVSMKFHSNVIEKIGWERQENESSITTMLRSVAISRLGFLGDKTAVSKMQAMFDDIFKGKSNIDPNLRGSAFQVSAWNGNVDTYNKLVKLYKAEEKPDEKRRILAALPSFQDVKLIEDSLKFSISKDVRSQDTFAIVGLAASNPKGTASALKWTKQNWRLLKSRYDAGTHMLGRFVDNFSALKSIEGKNDFKKFFGNKDNMRGDIKRALVQALERIDANIRFIEKNRAE